VIALKDVIKAGIRERFGQLRAMGIRTVMITGDNPLTAAAIAAEAGVDDFLAEATPEDKLALIRREQQGGRLVAMCGDGTNDAPALAQADVGVAMNTGTQAAREAGNMVDLDSDPTKLIEIVGLGKQLLMTRGALTTFSVANDVAKYFAIIPAMFVVLYPGLGALNVMGLASPRSAILSAIIFNALIIPALVPLALKGFAIARWGPGPAGAQSGGLWAGRPDRPVHRDQADRPGRGRAPSGLREKPHAFHFRFRPAPRCRDDRRLCPAAGRGLSRAGHRPWPAGLSQTGQWQPDRARRAGRGLRPARAGVCRARLFPPAPLGCRCQWL
jgi:soluble P-type ATPase